MFVQFKVPEANIVHLDKTEMKNCRIFDKTETNTWPIFDKTETNGTEVTRKDQFPLSVFNYHKD